MEIKCEYCGSIIKETDEKCPYCGATNQAVKRTADHTPKTIEELQQWYQARNLPPYEVTRFFIGIRTIKKHIRKQTAQVKNFFPANP